MFSDSPELVATDLYTSIVYCGIPKYKAYMGNAIFLAQICHVHLIVGLD